MKPAAPRLVKPLSADQRDEIGRALEQVSRFAEILRPDDVDEPILSPRVANAIHEWLVEIHNAAELAAVKVQPRSLALLYGPPGTGKTTLAHHLSARLGLPLVAVQSERIAESVMAGTGRNIGELFDLLKPIERHCVLLLDEFDAIGQKRQPASGRNSAITHDNNQALTILLRRIEAYRGVGLAATNTKEALDPALWRRFAMQISVDLPGENERFAILRKYAAPFDFEDASVDVLVDLTRGCSPSLLRQLMEGMKRTLVLAPRLQFDISNPARVFEHVISAIAPPPEMEQPPLWASTDRSLGELEGIQWPPPRG